MVFASRVPSLPSKPGSVRTNDRRFLFEKGRVKTQLVDALKRAAAFSGVELEAYVAMDNHFHIVCKVVRGGEELTEGEIRLTPGTMYGSLSKMEKDGLIRFVRAEEKRKIYQITELGREVLNLELKRIKRLYQTAMEVNPDDN